MKRFYKILAASCAITLIAASPAASMTTHAIGFNPDANDTTEREEVEITDDYWGNLNNDSSSNSSEPAPAPTPTPAPAPVENNSSYSEPSHNSGSSNSGSSSSAGSASYNSGSSSNASSGNVSAGNASVNSVPSAKKGSKDATVCVTGGQKFRIVISGDYTAYQVYHCGISRASFAVADADGNAVAFNNVKLEKGEDGLWYMNITFAEGVDTTEFTVSVTKGDATYLSTELGVSGIKINGTATLSTVPTAE